MSKILQRIKTSLNYVGALKKVHPVTLFILILGTGCFFLWALFEELLDIGVIHAHHQDIQSTLLQLGLWMVLLFFAAFLMETVIPVTQKVARALILAIASTFTFVHAGLLMGSFIFSDAFTKMAARIGDSALTMHTIGFLLVMFLPTVHACYRRMAEERTFADYLMGVISGLFLVGVIYAVVMVGLLILTAIFTGLLVGEFEDIFLPIAVLVTGGYLVGASTLVLIKNEEEIPTFVDVLFRYILFGMSLAAYVIIYMYMIKILVLSAFPSNSVFSILTSLFCVSVPLAYLNSYKDAGRMGEVARILPRFYLPLMILQAYTVIVRIRQYGLTPSRYLGIALVVVEAVILVWFMKKRDTLPRILPILALIVFVLTFVPGVNALAMPRFAQNMTLQRLLSRDAAELDEREKSRLYAAYDYLKYMDDGKEFLKSRYTRAQLSELERDDEEDSVYAGTTEYVSFDCEVYELDVEGYKSVRVFDGYAYEDGSPLQVDRVRLDIRQIGSAYSVYTGEEYYFDATELVALLKNPDYRTHTEEYGQAPLIYDKGDSRYVITSASISYDTYTEKLASISVDGHLLTREDAP